MSKIVRFRAPQSMKLQSMNPKEIEQLVESEVSKAMAKIPHDSRLVGVNAVSVDAARATGGGGWAEWTRACCGSRNQIEEYTDPVREEMVALETAARSGNVHVESQFIVED